MAEKAKCRVCGAEFNPCQGIVGIPPEQQPLNWRKVCCSVPCGSQFIKSVLESRDLGSDGTPAAPAPPEFALKPRRQAAKKPRALTEQMESEESTEPAAEGAE